MTIISADKLNKLGRLLFLKGNDSDASEIFHQSILENPHNASSYAFLGAICWRHQQTKEAISYYERGMELASADAEITQMVSDFLRLAGRIEETIRLHSMLATISGNRPQAAQSKKLLSIYDLSVQPFSVGDLINFQAGTLIKCAEYGLDTIDFCFICDPGRIPLEPVFSRMMGENNRLHNLFTIIPLLQLNPCIGSIHIFDSLRGLQNHLAANQTEYELWPTLEQIEANTYSYYEIIQLLEQSHRKNNFIQSLALPNALIHWNATFVLKNVSPMIPVTVNLRNNPNFQTDRNSNISAWTDFFNYCHGLYPVKFIVVCSLSEVSPELRSCPNVIVAKDHCTSLENDMALIMSSAFHIGAPSGPTMIPILGIKPYSIINCGSLLEILPTLVQESEHIARFSFANNLQRISLVPESTEVLKHEFETIWHSQDWRSWSPAPPPCGSEGLTWLK